MKRAQASLPSVSVAGQPAHTCAIPFTELSEKSKDLGEHSGVVQRQHSRRFRIKHGAGSSTTVWTWLASLPWWVHHRPRPRDAPCRSASRPAGRHPCRPPPANTRPWLPAMVARVAGLSPDRRRPTSTPIERPELATRGILYPEPRSATSRRGTVERPDGRYVPDAPPASMRATLRRRGHVHRSGVEYDCTFRFTVPRGSGRNEYSNTEPHAKDSGGVPGPPAMLGLPAQHAASYACVKETSGEHRNDRRSPMPAVQTIPRLPVASNHDRWYESL